MSAEHLGPLELGVGDVEAWVGLIEAASGDAEVAHGIEDALRGAVLRAVAAGHPQAVQLARAALGTGGVACQRWYA